MGFDNTRINTEQAPARNTEWETERAKRYVAANAHGVDDCRELLQMLGLMEPGFHWVTTRGLSGHGSASRRKIEEDA